METQKSKRASSGSLLRSDSSANDAPGTHISTSSDAMRDDYYGEEESEDAEMIKYPFFEAAFDLFLKLLENIDLEGENDAISKEFMESADSSKLMESAFDSTPNAKNEMEEIKRKINSFENELIEGIDEINSMFAKNSESEIFDKKSSKFTKLVKRFDSETEGVGANTYWFMLESLYIRFSYTIKRSPWASDIFDYFALSGKGVEEKSGACSRITREMPYN